LHAKGESLKPAFIGRKYSGLRFAAYKYFGSWRKALRAARIDEKEAYVKPEQLEAMRDLCAWSKKNGAINTPKMRASDPQLLDRIQRCFCNLRQASQTCGLPFESSIKVRSKPQIIEEIRALHAQGENIRLFFIRQANPKLLAAAYRYFGSWANALHEAGFDETYSTPLRMRPKKVLCAQL